jgi:hypothetical protein
MRLPLAAGHTASGRIGNASPEKVNGSGRVLASGVRRDFRSESTSLSDGGVGWLVDAVPDQRIPGCRLVHLVATQVA